MKKWIRTVGAGLFAALLVWQLTALPGLAASTGTVTASDVNIRQDASTSASIVGTATLGETYAVGESKQDSDGKTWYQITLTDGQTGYIREDFITVEEDTAAAASTEEAEEQTPYSITKETGQDGTPTYYFVDSSNGLRLSLDEIAEMTNQVTTLQAQLPTAGNSGRIAVIILILLLILAGVVDVSLYTRLLNEARAGNRPRTAGSLLKRGSTAAAGRKRTPAGRRSEREREEKRTVAERDAAGRKIVHPAAASEKPIMDFTFGDPAEAKKEAAPEDTDEEAKTKERDGDEEEKNPAIPPQDTFAGKLREQGEADRKKDTAAEEKPAEKTGEDKPESDTGLKNGPSISSFRADEEPDGNAANATTAQEPQPQLRPHAINWAADEEPESPAPAEKPKQDEAKK